MKPHVSLADDGAIVKAAAACWDDVCRVVFEHSDDEFAELVRQWGPYRANDPIVIPVDLLSPIGKDRRETSHTQVLAFLLDPRREHGFGTKPLDGFLAFLRGCTPAGSLPAFSKSELEHALVESERVEALDTDDESTEHPKTDLWIEIPEERPRLIVMVENKIDTSAFAGQLDRYDRALATRLASLRPRPAVSKVYLTPGGDEPGEKAGGQDWHPGCLYEVVHEWLNLVNDPAPPGVEFLRLYLATVFQKIYGVSWSERPSRALKGEICKYLRERIRRLP